MTRNPVLIRLAAVPLAALLAFAAAQAVSAPNAVDGFERGIGIIVLAAGLIAAILAPPAYTIAAALVLSIFSSHWHLMEVSQDLDRGVLAIGAASLLYREWRHKDGRLETRPVDWGLIVAAAFALLSALFAGELEDRAARFELIDTYGIVPFILFFLAPFAFRTERDRRVLLGALVGLGAYLGLVALAESAGGDDLIVPAYITDQTIGGHLDRARGPFLDAAANGLAIYMCGVAAVIAFVRWRTTAWRVVAFLVALLCALGVVFCLTRAVWLGAIIGTPLALAAGSSTRRYLVPVGLSGLVVVVAALALVPNLREHAEERKNDQRPLFDRRNSNAAALRMIADKPLWGHGWDRFEEESKPYYRQSHDYPLTIVKDLHNLYLSHMVELGLIGALLWGAAVTYAIGGAILRRGPPELTPWKVGLVAVAVGLLVSWAAAPSGFLMPTLLMWCWAGVAWGGRAGPDAAKT